MRCRRTQPESMERGQFPSIKENWHPIRPKTKWRWDCIPCSYFCMSYPCLAAKYHSSLLLDRILGIQIFQSTYPERRSTDIRLHKLLCERFGRLGSMRTSTGEMIFVSDEIRWVQFRRSSYEGIKKAVCDVRLWLSVQDREQTCISPWHYAYLNKTRHSRRSIAFGQGGHI
jgi:hypothetical protein